MKTRADTPTVIRHFATDQEIGLVISVGGNGAFGAEFQIYARSIYDPDKHYPEVECNTIGRFKSTSGQYSDERDAIAKFDKWVYDAKAREEAARKEFLESWRRYVWRVGHDGPVY